MKLVRFAAVFLFATSTFAQLTNEDLPILLAGGGIGKIKGGRHIRYPKGTPLTNLYLSIFEIAGVSVDRMGDSTGKLDHLSV